MGAQETKPSTKGKHMKNFLINSASIFAGKRFARLYKNPKASTTKVYKALDTYRALRRMLPVEARTGNHMGNHSYSRKRPFLATQGYKVRTLSSPSV